MKTREEEILEMGMGPRRVMPEEETDINTGRFAADTPFKPLYQPGDKAAMNHAKNRESREIKRGEEGYRTREFEYELDKDPLWQQYISSARRNGQNAMTDTMAKVASQTGGIAGSYAVSAGAGAYNDYIQRANDVIPELEQIAYQKYQDDLARDREIYEMDEAKRIEDAQYNATMHGHQNYGRPLTDEEKMLIYANGGYVTPDGDVIDDNGNLIKRGTKYDEDVAEAKAETEAEAIKEASDKANIAIVNYMLGNEPKAEDVLMLAELGYNYANGVLYDPTGNPIAQSYKNPEKEKTPSGKKATGDDEGDKPPVVDDDEKPRVVEGDDNDGKPKIKTKGTNVIEGTVETLLLMGAGKAALDYLEEEVENGNLTEGGYVNILNKFGLTTFGVEA